MDAVNYTDLRQNLKARMDKVYHDHEPLIITRKNNENLVLISLEDYNSFVETQYLLSTKNNADHLMKSLHAARSGTVLEKELIEEWIYYSLLNHGKTISIGRRTIKKSCEESIYWLRTSGGALSKAEGNRNLCNISFRAAGRVESIRNIELSTKWMTIL